MHHFETVLALLVGVTFLALVARRLAIPTPAVLLAGGVLVALLPGLPAVQFDPQLVFLVFIPPLLFRASLLASYRDVRANLRPILLLGVGHVLFATLAVAWVAHRAVPGLPWASACALGAVVSPPDVAAATSGGDTTAPSANADAQGKPGIAWCATQAITLVANTTCPTPSDRIGRKLARTSR